MGYSRRWFDKRSRLRRVVHPNWRLSPIKSWRIGVHCNDDEAFRRSDSSGTLRLRGQLFLEWYSRVLENKVDRWEKDGRWKVLSTYDSLLLLSASFVSANFHQVWPSKEGILSVVHEPRPWLKLIPATLAISLVLVDALTNRHGYDVDLPRQRKPLLGLVFSWNGEENVM